MISSGVRCDFIHGVFSLVRQNWLESIGGWKFRSNLELWEIIVLPSWYTAIGLDFPIKTSHTRWRTGKSQNAKSTLHIQLVHDLFAILAIASFNFSLPVLCGGSHPALNKLHLGKASIFAIAHAALSRDSEAQYSYLRNQVLRSVTSPSKISLCSLRNLRASLPIFLGRLLLILHELWSADSCGGSSDGTNDSSF